MRLADPQIPNNLGGREGTAMLGAKRGRSLHRSRTTWAAVKGPQCWGQRGGAVVVVDCRHHPHQEK